MTGNSSPISPQANRILVMRYRFIGDTILTVPFLRNLRYAYPQAVIDVLVGPQSGEVLKGCPYINELIEFDTTRYHKYDKGARSTKSFLSYVMELRQRHYDTAFVLKRSLSSAALSYLIGTRARIGYSMPGRNFLLTKAVKWDSHKHEVESTLDVLRAAGIPILDNHLEAWISPQERAQVEQLAPQITSNSNHYLVHAAAAHPAKLYPIASWAQVIAGLYSQLGLIPVFTGAALDHALYEELGKMCQKQISSIDYVNLAGALTLRQSMALYKQLQFAICVDSGPAHLSAAVGTPTIAIFGPTDPQRWRPFGDSHSAIYDTTLACRPCHYKMTCSDRPCLTQMPASVIVRKAIETFEGKGKIPDPHKDNCALPARPL
jgi:heptosyltransferase-2